MVGHRVLKTKEEWSELSKTFQVGLMILEWKKEGPEIHKNITS
jgi:hypothetical protein